MILTEFVKSIAENGEQYRSFRIYFNGAANL